MSSQPGPHQTNMTRSRSDEPIPARRRNAAAVIGTSLNPVFDDQTSFVDDIVQYSHQVLEALQALGRRDNRDHLGRVRELALQVERIKTDVSDVRRSQFDGLRRLCTDRQPECRHFMNPLTTYSDRVPQVSSSTRSIPFFPS